MLLWRSLWSGPFSPHLPFIPTHVLRPSLTTVRPRADVRHHVSLVCSRRDLSGVVVAPVGRTRARDARGRRPRARSPARPTLRITPSEAIVEHMLNGYYRHWRLYKFVFTPQLQASRRAFFEIEKSNPCLAGGRFRSCASGRWWSETPCRCRARRWRRRGVGVPCCGGPPVCNRSVCGSCDDARRRGSGHVPQNLSLIFAILLYYI